MYIKWIWKLLTQQPSTKILVISSTISLQIWDFADFITRLSFNTTILFPVSSILIPDITI